MRSKFSTKFSLQLLCLSIGYACNWNMTIPIFMSIKMTTSFLVFFVESMYLCSFHKRQIYVIHLLQCFRTARFHAMIFWNQKASHATGPKMKLEEHPNPSNVMRGAFYNLRVGYTMHSDKNLPKGLILCGKCIDWAAIVSLLTFLFRLLLLYYLF